jgi:hypothetical protein
MPRSRAAAAAAAAALLLLLASAAAQMGDDVMPRPPNGPPVAASGLGPQASSYIVVMNDNPPVVAADDSVATAYKLARPRRAAAAGVSATAEVPSDVRAAAAAEVDAYEAHLRALQSDALSSVAPASASVPAAAAASEGPRLVQHYTYALNGFHAAGLSEDQAAALRARPGVQSVTRAGWRYPDTFTTPSFLGLNGTGELWEHEFGSPQAAARQILIGIVDTGAFYEDQAGRVCCFWQRFGDCETGAGLRARLAWDSWAAD